MPKKIRISHKPWRTMVCLGLSMPGLSGRDPDIDCRFSCGFFLRPEFRSRHSDRVDLCNGMRGCCFNWFLVIRHWPVPPQDSRLALWAYCCFGLLGKSGLPGHQFLMGHSGLCGFFLLALLHFSRFRPAPGRAGRKSTIWPSCMSMILSTIFRICGLWVTMIRVDFLLVHEANGLGKAVFAFLVKIGIGLVRSTMMRGSPYGPAPGQPAAAGRRKARRQVRPFACQQPFGRLRIISCTPAKPRRWMTFFGINRAKPGNVFGYRAAKKLSTSWGR